MTEQQNPFRPMDEAEIDRFVSWVKGCLEGIPSYGKVDMITHVLQMTRPLTILELVRLANTITVLREENQDLREGFACFSPQDGEE